MATVPPVLDSWSARRQARLARGAEPIQPVPAANAPAADEPGPLVTSIAVWPVRPQLPLQINKAFANVIADFGDGFEQRGNKNEAYSHPDGLGNITANKGRWEFQIQLNGIDFANGNITKEVNQLWQFVTNQLGGFTAFYFYNPLEAPIDLTGASAVGRYLVRIKDPLTSLEAFAVALHRGKLTFIEVRS